MNIYNLIVFAIFVFAVFAYSLSGVTNALFSTISFIFSALIIRLMGDRVVNWLSNFGWKENIYTPSLVFVFLFIITWGIIFTFSSYFPSLSKNSNRYIKFITALISAFVSSIIIMNVVCVSLPPFISSQESELNLKASLMCTGCSLKFLQSTKPRSLQDNMERAILPQTNTEVILLPDNYSFLSQSAFLEERLLTIINDTRKDSGAIPLIRSSEIDKLAASYARNILETRRFSHVDLQNQMPADRARKIGLKFDYFGENLAAASSVDKANQAIIESQSHRDNLVSPAYRQIGLAVVNVSANEVLVVEEFSN